MAVIDLSQLPAPEVVEVPDFEALLAERKAAFIALYPADEQEAVRRTLALESEPVVKLLQENAYREILLRQRINEAAQAVMVAYALGSDLDLLAANYNLKRLTITPADPEAIPPVEAEMETDDDLRLRVPDAFEGLSVAGPKAAYEFYAKSADGRVAYVSATSPAPAEVLITILSREGDGTAPADLLAGVGSALNDESVRPVADRVTVQGAEIFPYRVEARLHLYDGVVAGPCLDAANAALATQFAATNRPTAQQARLLEQAKNRAGELQQKYNGLWLSVQRQREALNAAGIDTKQLSVAQRRLKTDAEAASGAIERQQATLKKLGERQQKLSAIRARREKTQELRNNLAGNGAGMLASGVATGMTMMAPVESLGEMFGNLSDQLAAMQKAATGAAGKAAAAVGGLLQ